jgi:3-oxoacyl-[acyl-carrier protein] reductase
MTHINKKAVVTGAAQGIGLGIASRLAKEGAFVAICDINGKKAEQEAEKLTKEGLKVIAVQADVSSTADIHRMIDRSADQFGGLDIVVNNAGVLDSSSILDMKEETWDRVLAINLRGTFFCCQAAIPYLKKSSAPRIVNISSLAGRMGGFETSLSYTASKGGILSITMGMARQLAPFGITVNALCPGTTESDIIKQWSPEQIASLKQRVPLGRLGSITDMAGAAAFLTSDDAGFITGVFLDVNGGMYMG